MNTYNVQSKGVVLIENVDYHTALTKATSHVSKTNNAAHIIALASNKVRTTVYKEGYFPLKEYDEGLRAKNFVTVP